jgi:hypothetical protein
MKAGKRPPCSKSDCKNKAIVRTTEGWFCGKHSPRKDGKKKSWRGS